MLITPATMSAFFTGLDANFSTSYQTTASWASQLATTLPSDSEIEQYGWVGRIPTLREWLGPRVAHSMAAETLIVPNKLFELTLEVDRIKLEDDKYGIFANDAQQLGWQSKKWPDQTITSAIRGNINCTDGRPFFDASHPVDLYDATKGTFTNAYTTTALTAGNYASVREAMMIRVAQDGQPLGVIPNLLVVPPQLEYVARQILHADFIAPNAIGAQTQVGAVTNTLKGSADLLVIPELAADATTWYLLCTTMPIKPVVWQLRKAPEFVARTNPQDPKVFDERKFVYGVEARGAAVLTFPFLASRAVA